MSRTFTRIAMAAATAGLLTLAACGDEGGTQPNGQSDTTVVADTLPAAATDTSVATADTEAPTTTAGADNSAETVDQLEQAIAEAEALLGATDKDLADAQKGASNGG